MLGCVKVQPWIFPRIILFNILLTFSIVESKEIWMCVYASLQLFTSVSYIILKSDISCYHGNHFEIKIHLLLGYQENDSERNRKGQNIRAIQITLYISSHSFKGWMKWAIAIWKEALQFGGLNLRWQGGQDAVKIILIFMNALIVSGCVLFPSLAGFLNQWTTGGTWDGYPRSLLSGREISIISSGRRLSSAGWVLGYTLSESPHPPPIHP